MAVTYDIYLTALHGIPNTNLQAVEAGIVWTSDQFGDPICSLDHIPLANIDTWNQVFEEDTGFTDFWTPFVLDVVFCTPDKVVDNVHHIRFVKNSGTINALIQFEDETNTVLHSVSLTSNFVCSRVNNPSPPPLYGKSTQVRFQLIAYVNAQNELSLGFAMCNGITKLARSQQPLLNPYYLQCSSSIDGFTEQWITDIIGDDIWSADPGGEGGESGFDGDPAGGDGEFFRSDIDIPYTELPQLSVADTGFVSLYKVDAGQMQNLANDLWDDNFFQSLAKYFSDPFQNLISLGLIPYDVVGTLQNIRIANYTCPMAAGDKLSSTYFALDCGNVSVKEYYRHFGDYETQIQLFLPYCGTISINPSEVMEGTIGVRYIFDVFSGACTAQVMCYTGSAHHVLYQKEGNIRTELPISGANYAEYYKGLIASIGVMVGAAAFGAVGISAATTTAALAKSALVAGAGVAGGLGSGLTQKPTYERSGNISGTPGMLGIQYPYLIFTTPNYFGGKSIGDKCGYVSNLPCKIGDQRGFLQSEVDFEKLSGIEAPFEIIQKIKEALAEGVYIESIS